VVRGAAGGDGLRAHGDGQDAGGRGGVVRGPPRRLDGLLHHAPDRADRAEVPRHAGAGGQVGVPPQRRGAGDRQPPRELRGPNPGRRGRGPLQPAAPRRGLRFLAGERGGHGRVPQLQRPGAGRGLGAHPGPPARARPHPAPLGHGGQSAGVHRVAAGRPTAAPGAGAGRAAARAAGVPVGARPAAQRADRGHGRRRRNEPPHARFDLLLQPRGMLERGRAAQGQAPHGPRPAGATRRDAQGARLVARGRAEAQAVAPARGGRAPRRPAAQVPPDRGRPLPAQTALRGGLHRNALRRHQPAGPLRGAPLHDEGAAGQEAGPGAQRCPPDVRPRRPTPVRHPRLRVRAGARRRRQDRPLEGKIRPHPRGHQGPHAAEAQERPQAQGAQAARDRAVLDRGPVRQAAGRQARQADQPGAAPLALAGLHARRLAGGRSHPPPGRQALDGQRPAGGRPARAGSDAPDAVAGGLRDAGAEAHGCGGVRGFASWRGRQAGWHALTKRGHGPGECCRRQQRQSTLAGWPARIPDLGPYRLTRRARPLPARPGPPNARASQAGPVPRAQSALRSVPGKPTRDRQPGRADPGHGERARVAPLGGAFCARAAPGPHAAGPVGHRAPGRATAPPRSGHARRAAVRPGGGIRPPPQLLRRATQVGAHSGREASPAVRLRVPGRARGAHPGSVGGGRGARIRRRLQQVRHQQGPPETGGHHLPAPPPPDPPGRGIQAVLPPGSHGTGVGR